LTKVDPYCVISCIILASIDALFPQQLIITIKVPPPTLYATQPWKQVLVSTVYLEVKNLFKLLTLLLGRSNVTN